MRIQHTTAHLRARAVTVAVLIALGVLLTMGVGHAAPAASGASPAASSAEPKDDKSSDGKGKGGGGSKDDKDGHKNGGKDKKDGGKDGGKDKKDGDKGKKDGNHVEGTPCTRSAHACVDLGAKRAWLIDRGGKVVRGPVPISSGKPGHETPRGMFPVLFKDKDHRSREFDNAPMPNSVFFAEGGIAFHGGDVNRQSSGCIHLAPPDDVAFFDFLAVGDEVQIH